MNNSIPQEKDLAEIFDQVAYTLDKAYINRLTSDYSACSINVGQVDYTNNIRLIKVKRWVKDTNESIIDCFKNALGVFSSIVDNNIAMILKHVPGNTEMYFAIRTVGNHMNSISKENIDLLKSALSGNFLGSEFEVISCDNGADFFETEKISSVSTVCGIPSQKSEEYLTQGIEKLLDGMVPKKKDESYTLIILAEPLSSDESRKVINGYEELASVLTPFSVRQIQNMESQSVSEGVTKSKSLAKSVSTAISNTFSINANIGFSIGISGPADAKVNPSIGFGYSHGKTETEGTVDAEADGVSYSVSDGEMKGETYTQKSYPISGLIAKAEKTIERLIVSQSNGTWKYAAYALSPSSSVSKSVAGFFSAVMQGDESYVELPHVNSWSRIKDPTPDQMDFNNILTGIIHFTHPVFANKADNTTVTATSYISTNELSTLFAFPKYSVQGLPVVECARFGREPHSLGKLSGDVRIGSPYYMHHKEEGRISLGLNELAKHTFITGTTGSGKSNTVYKLLSEVCLSQKSKVKFMVIEPAKGEYKDVFGGYPDVTVYGTNPYKFPNLLQINPFYFPDDIHVLEHVDRLVEVFNACWPMYAAMPAILKESVERAYENCGWNLRTSKNPGRYPTFSDLLNVLPQVIESSNYSSDTSSDYKGALITRVRSLTRGIHGQIFSGNTNDDALFNTNVIVDISRVGSSETKSLLMGILILRLQEFRMHEDRHNSELRHLTVVEEAHHLLRKTANTQTQESSNLQGKSVEMIGNAIAEMRTYGEGFIIADQSPELMDASVIRNTNTKIIMRLPEESDRTIVGKAAGLTDSQIVEVSKFACGVAAILQSEWLEPVLCLVDEFTAKKSMSQRYKSSDYLWEDSELKVKQKFIELAMGVKNHSLTKEEVDCIRKWYKELRVSETALRIFELVLHRQKLEPKEKILLVSYCVGGNVREILEKNDLIEEINRLLISKFEFSGQSDVIRLVDNLLNQCFTDNYANEILGKSKTIR